MSDRYDAILRIPTKAPYSYIELKVEKGTKESIVQAMLDVTEYYWTRQEQAEKD